MVPVGDPSVKAAQDVQLEFDLDKGERTPESSSVPLLIEKKKTLRLSKILEFESIKSPLNALI